MSQASKFRRAIFALAIVLAVCPFALALDPTLDISQYAHTAWKVRDGFSKGTIFAIAQTPDGYLWFGTQFGLLRFDGVRPVAWQPPTGQQLPSDRIFSLLAARDGTLWIGTYKGLASWKDGKLKQYPELDGQDIFALYEDREATVWIGGLSLPPVAGRLCATRSGSLQCYGEDGKFGQGIGSLDEDSKGNFWVGDSTGLWRWKPGPPRHYVVPGHVEPVYSIIESDDGKPLMATGERLQQLAGGKIEEYSISKIGRQLRARTLFRSGEGSLWIGTQDQGVFHVHQGRTDWFAQPDGLSGNSVDSVFEDREGSIWVATERGLDRFSDVAVATISIKEGLGTNNVISVLAATDGSIWIGSNEGTIRWKDGQATKYRKQRPARVTDPIPESPLISTAAVREVTDSGLPDWVESFFQDRSGRIWVSTPSGVAYFDGSRFIPVTGIPGGELFAITGDSQGSVWFTHQDNGLFRLLEGNRVEAIPWSQLSRDDHGSVLAADPVQGGLWLGFSRGGLAYLKDGQVGASYAAADGMGQVTDLKPKSDGTLWAVTENGLSRIKDGHVVTLTSKNGLPCDAAHWVEEDNDRSIWLYLECGLVRISAPELEAWLADPKHKTQVTVFDSSDGVRLFPRNQGYGPRVTKSADGKLWFMTPDGVSVIDPRHIQINKLPPPVHIEQVTADGKTYETSQGLRLPPRVRDVWIDYSALSFIAPQKVRFRYKLEGQDPDWKEVVNNREAQYSNLAPGNYRFRVIASNNSGVWNEAGTFLDFSVDPAYYQTTWFRLLVVAVFLTLLAALYQLRLRQVARQFNIRLEERVRERTRIARDLHDTLLQSFQGVLLQFHTVTYLLPDGADEARNTLESVIEQAREAITEGRDAVQGLRSLPVINDLARAISTLGEELAADQAGPNCPDFTVLVEGTPRDLAPFPRDETYRIAIEAVRNAFRHAHARRIEVEIRYGQRQLRVRVRDNGKGIAPKVLSGHGLDGHYGLTGMHERATSVGGKLAVWSELDSGTEAELTIPASIAYIKSPAARRSTSSEKGSS